MSRCLTDRLLVHLGVSYLNEQVNFPAFADSPQTPVQFLSRFLNNQDSFYLFACFQIFFFYVQRFENWRVSTHRRVTSHPLPLGAPRQPTDINAYICLQNWHQRFRSASNHRCNILSWVKERAWPPSEPLIDDVARVTDNEFEVKGPFPPSRNPLDAGLPDDPGARQHRRWLQGRPTRHDTHTRRQRGSDDVGVVIDRWGLQRSGGVLFCSSRLPTCAMTKDEGRRRGERGRARSAEGRITGGRGWGTRRPRREATEAGMGVHVGRVEKVGLCFFECRPAVSVVARDVPFFGGEVFAVGQRWF